MVIQVRDRSLGPLGADGTLSEILTVLNTVRVGKGLRRVGV
jgi:hypothetical protein